MRPSLCLSLALLSPFAFAQATKPEDPIDAARPDFSDATSIVPVRHLQIEAGLSFFRQGGKENERWQLGEALLRYGVLPRVEVRLVLPNETMARRVSGLDNTTVAASFYLGKAFGFNCGVVPGVTFPTGDAALRDEAVAPSLELNLARDLGRGGVASTLLALFGREDGRSAVSGSGTLEYQQPVARALVGFVEYYGVFDPRAEPESYAHLGLKLLASARSQVDVHVGVGLNEAAAHEFVGAGYSVRF